MSQILVIGASGTVGSELSELLKAKGHKVLRATSQKTIAPDQVYVNLAKCEGLDQAFEGVDKLFVLIPPGYTNQDVLAAPLIEKAQEKNLKQVVLMTAMGANANAEAPLRKAEVQLENSGLSYNIIRPNWFMQNFNTFWVQGILEHNTIFLPVAKAKGSFIDSRDISAVAAALLDKNQFPNQEFDLTGARALDHDEVAKLISTATGKAVKFQDITPDEMRTGLLQAGLPTDYAEFLIMILGYFKEGYSERTTDAVQKITGKAPRTIEQYVQDYKKEWLKN